MKLSTKFAITAIAQSSLSYAHGLAQALAARAGELAIADFCGCASATLLVATGFSVVAFGMCRAEGV